MKVMNERVRAAVAATSSAGAALLALRGTPTSGIEAGRGQLKTPVDHAAEGWVLGYLRTQFAEDVFLSEESFEDASSAWTPSDAFWTVDALDGTRSYVEGFDGFCVQVAFVAHGDVAIAVIHEPVARRTFWAVKGQGAYVNGAGSYRRLTLSKIGAWPANPRFVDSRLPEGLVGALFTGTGGRLVECGSFGLKFCRVAGGSADVFAKNVTTALWDAAPGCLIVQEAGGIVGRWDGTPIRFASSEVYFDDLLVAPAGLFELASSELMSQSAARR